MYYDEHRVVCHRLNSLFFVFFAAPSKHALQTEIYRRNVVSSTRVTPNYTWVLRAGSQTSPSLNTDWPIICCFFKLTARNRGNEHCFSWLLSPSCPEFWKTVQEIATKNQTLSDALVSKRWRNYKRDGNSPQHCYMAATIWKRNITENQL